MGFPQFEWYLPTSLSWSILRSAINILFSDNYVIQRKESDHFPRVKEQVIFGGGVCVDILLKNDIHIERCADLMHIAQWFFTS